MVQDYAGTATNYNPSIIYSARFGVVGDGVSDNAATLSAACAYAAAFNLTLNIPDGIFVVKSPIECDANVNMSNNAIIQAGTPGMPYVVTVGNLTAAVKDGWWRGGVIDAHLNAQEGMYIQWAQHYNVTDTYFTDEAGVAGGGAASGNVGSSGSPCGGGGGGEGSGNSTATSAGAGCIVITYTS
jgi:hypothetical protein